MSTLIEFQNSFGRYKKETDDFLKNDLLPTDHTTPSFIKYFTSFGYFIDKAFTYIPTKFQQEIEEVYTKLFLLFANFNGDNESLITDLIKSFEQIEIILNEALQIQSNIDIYRTEPLELFKTRTVLHAIIKDRKKTEALKQKEYEEIEKLTTKSKQDVSEIENIRTRMENLVEELRIRYKNDLANFEIKKQGEIFRDAAISNKKSSLIWGVIIILLLILLIIFSCIFIAACWKDSCAIFSIYSKQPPEFLRTLFYTDLAKNILIRVFLLSIVVLLMKYAMKHFNALMHNHTINTHKADSLAAAMRIFDSITNETTREQVITIAAKEIFTQQKTGYLAKDESKLDLNILEKISSLFKK